MCVVINGCLWRHSLLSLGALQVSASGLRPQSHSSLTLQDFEARVHLQAHYHDWCVIWPSNRRRRYCSGWETRWTEGGVVYRHRSLFIFSLWNVVGWQWSIQCVLRLTVLSTINLTVACSYMWRIFHTHTRLPIAPQHRCTCQWLAISQSRVVPWASIKHAKIWARLMYRNLISEPFIALAGHPALPEKTC